MQELKPSTPADVKPRGEKLIQLPEIQGDGSRIVIRIAQKYASDLWAEAGGMQALAEVPRGKETRLVGDEARKVLEKIAAAGILEPQFSFGSRVHGMAFWDDLSFANQAFVVNEIMAFAGIHLAVSESSDGEEAAAGRLASFPDRERAGMGDGGRTPATQPDHAQASSPRRGAGRNPSRGGARSGARGNSRRAAAS